MSPDARTDARDCRLIVGDRTVATIAAYEATQTPGVAGLRPYAVHAAKDSVNRAARRAAAVLTRQPESGSPVASGDVADPAAVAVERRDGTGPLTVTIRIVAATTPPVLQIVGDVQSRVARRLAAIAEVEAEVIVNVIDIRT